MTDKNKRIIEIDGVKLEMDLRKAKQIDTFKVGDNVKVLVKDYSEYKSYPGVIIGFDNFEKLPTIIVAYLKTGYSEAEIEYVYINAQKKDDKPEIVRANEKVIGFDKGRVVELLDNEIEKKKQELKDAQTKKKYFLDHFNKFFKTD